MKHYTVAAARQHIAEALDEADRGTEVIIERRGVRYQLTVQRQKRRTKEPANLVEVLDAELLDSGWTWTRSPAGELALEVGAHAVESSPGKATNGPRKVARRR